MSPERVMTHRYEAVDADSCRDWVAATEARFGGCDAVVNNAGALAVATLEDDDESGLELMWEVNVMGPLRLLRAAWPGLKRAGSGRVVNLVSLSGKRVKSAQVGAYSVSKHAALALTHWVRQEGWEHGIRATALCPGFVATDMSAQLTGFSPDKMIQPETIATLVATVLALPNTATVAELPVSCMLEASY
jgi:NAD(P)-dependent dehydrogenase (short-subunit alcohol dehydrogenase family)